MKNRYYNFWLLPLILFLQASQPVVQQSVSNNYALFFAVSDYESSNGLADLQNPVRNAREIAKELREKYNFQADIVENPTLEDIKDKFEEYENKFKRGGGFDSKGQLLIFFSGHGVKRYDQGFFMPADGDPDDPFYTGIPYDLWRNKIDALNCQHILVAVDACHSAHFDPNFEDRPDKDFKRNGELSETEKILEDHKKYKARFFFTSDGEGEETPDRSNFAKKFLEAFRTNNSIDGFMTSSMLFASYLKRATPRPRGGSFGQDEASANFLFFEKTKREINTRSYAQKAADLSAWKRAQNANTIEAYDQYLNMQLNGGFRQRAQEAIQTLADDIDWEIAQAQDTKETYQLYLRQHPSGQYVEQATRKASLENKPSTTPTDDDLDLPDMVFVQGGTFQMGNQFGDGGSDEKPVHNVTVSDFYISNHEVTFFEYDQYCIDTNIERPSDASWGRGNRPVINVSWYDAVKYCNWKSEQDNLQKVYTIKGNQVSARWLANGYRLPTEAEWEYAARNRGKQVRFGNGMDIADANEINFDASNDYSKQDYSLKGNSAKMTMPYGSYQASPIGLYDMSGNVWEWCWDWYSNDYYTKSMNTRNPKGPDTGFFRVNRGGGWVGTPENCRAADRGDWDPSGRNNRLGFRLVHNSI